MSLRTRSKNSIKETPPIPIPTQTNTTIDEGRRAQGNQEEERRLIDKTPSSTTFSQQALTQALTSTAQLANLLPTGTLVAFQLLTPVFSNRGSCDSATRLMTQLLLLLLAASCFLACFTDSFKSQDGQLYYGFATLRGMWLFDYPTGSTLPELANYRLRIIDCVHAILSALVFASVALRDKDVLNCLYPQPKSQMQEVLDILPLGVGVICSLLFVVFPTRRHGIGYPVSSGN